MRKLSIEVKTIYHIRFDFHDFLEIFAKAKSDPARIHAFDNFDLDDTTMGNVRECFKSLGKCSWFLTPEGSEQQSKNLKYIVEKLGFYGIDNYGGFYESEDEYSITVYNRGADI